MVLLGVPPGFLVQETGGLGIGCAFSNLGSVTVSSTYASGETELTSRGLWQESRLALPYGNQRVWRICEQSSMPRCVVR